MFFDSHAHLDGERFKDDLPDTLTRAADAGLTDIVCIGASEGFESNAEALSIAERGHQLSGGRLRFYATVGVHPHDAKIVDDACLDAVRRLASHDQVVAIGETGLDYFYNHSETEKQKTVFRQFLALSRELSLPVVVHTRDAEDDTIEILRSEEADKIGGVIHCFTGTDKLADAAIDLGLYVSFSGVLTFKSAQNLRNIAARLPRDRVLVETDCPYLTPVPLRGKRNEPSYVLNTTQTLSELWGLPLEETMALTGENAARFFRTQSA